MESKIEKAASEWLWCAVRPLIGNTVREFDLKPTGTGKVTVTITVTPPQPNAKAKVTKIEFDVK